MNKLPVRDKYRFFIVIALVITGAKLFMSDSLAETGILAIKASEPGWSVCVNGNEIPFEFAPVTYNDFQIGNHEVELSKGSECYTTNVFVEENTIVVVNLISVLINGQGQKNKENNEIIHSSEHYQFTEESPPPPSIHNMEEEVVDFFDLTRPLDMAGGLRAVAEYIRQKNLYPESAKAAGVEGVALLNYLVSKAGVPGEIKVLKEIPENYGFGDVAKKAVSEMRYSPGFARERPASMKMQMIIRFKLN